MLQFAKAAIGRFARAPAHPKPQLQPQPRDVANMVDAASFWFDSFRA